MIVGYCRVGPLEPMSRLERQKSALSRLGAQLCFCERVGLTGQAPELERAIAATGRGDTIVVTRPYRVALSTRGVLELIARLGRKGVGLRIPGTPVDTGTTTGRMVLGSVPRWSLGISPPLSLLHDISLGWLRHIPISRLSAGRQAGQNR